MAGNYGGYGSGYGGGGGGRGPMTREEYEYHRMKEMYFATGQKDSDADKVVVKEPEKPKHMNQKLLLLKGA